jgi:hypothetical protein
MKKLLLSSVTFFLASVINAQSCTPGSNFADSIFGVWPDTVKNFPPGEVGVSYTTDLNFKVPNTVTPEVTGGDPVAANFVGSPIQSFTVDSVSGLPAGIDYACNVLSCTYTGGSNGCANLFGLSNISGTYPLILHITVNLLIDPGVLIGFPTNNYTYPFSYPASFSGYRLTFGNAGAIEQVIQPFSAYPNPASTKITLDGLSDKLNVNAITISNMEGKVIGTHTSVTENTMDIDISSFENGIYFVNIQYEQGKETIKFVKD